LEKRGNIHKIQIDQLISYTDRALIRSSHISLAILSNEKNNISELARFITTYD